MANVIVDAGQTVSLFVYRNNDHSYCRFHASASWNGIVQYRFCSEFSHRHIPSKHAQILDKQSFHIANL